MCWSSSTPCAPAVYASVTPRRLCLKQVRAVSDFVGSHLTQNESHMPQTPHVEQLSRLARRYARMSVKGSTGISIERAGWRLQSEGSDQPGLEPACRRRLSATRPL